MVSIVEILGKDKSTKDKEILAHRKHSFIFCNGISYLLLGNGKTFLNSAYYEGNWIPPEKYKYPSRQGGVMQVCDTFNG